MSSDEFIKQYSGLLKNLTRNEKRDINVLSMLAEDNQQWAPWIVTSIEEHILTVTVIPLAAPSAGLRSAV